MCSASEEIFTDFFKDLKQTLTSLKISSDNIFIFLYMNETGWSKMQQFRHRKLHPVASSHPIEVQNQNLDHNTSVHTIQSSGHSLPTMIIYKNNIPVNHYCTHDFVLKSSESGFINKDIFNDYVLKILVPCHKKRKKRPLFFNNG